MNVVVVNGILAAREKPAFGIVIYPRRDWSITTDRISWTTTLFYSDDNGDSV